MYRGEFKNATFKVQSIHTIFTLNNFDNILGFFDLKQILPKSFTTYVDQIETIHLGVPFSRL